MPITPLHIGPGTFFKLFAGKRMSLVVFGVSQVFMDLEVVGRLVLGFDRLHGFTNTILGATTVLVASVFLGKPISEAALKWWNRNLSAKHQRLLAVDDSITRFAAWSGAALGVYSHWFLDALMHGDARPLWPFSDANQFIGWLSIDNNNLVCMALLILGGTLLLLKFAVLQLRTSE